LLVQDPNLWLSAFNDGAASTTVTAAIAEAKSPSGSFTEGVYQLSVASASVLARFQILSQGLEKREELPGLGWVVHGYFWFLHVTYKQHDGSIVSSYYYLLSIALLTILTLPTIACPWSLPFRQHSTLSRHIPTIANYSKGQPLGCIYLLAVSKGHC
jgi:hypothetical protein